MRACIEHVIRGRVDGWAYKDDDPSARLAMQLLLDGQVIAEARAEKYREDLKRNGLGDGLYGYEFTELSHPDLPMAYLGGRIAVRATSDALEPVEAEPAFYLREETEGFLRVQLLESGGLPEFLAYMNSAQPLDAGGAALSLNLLNASRAHFAQWVFTTDFLRLGASLAALAGRPHTERYYAAQLQRVIGHELMRSTPTAVARPPLPATYGTLAEWIEPPPAVNLEILEPLFFSGSRRPSFMQEVGLLEQGDPAVPRVKVLAFREDAFGGTGWWVKQNGADIPVARNLYYLEFELLRSVLDEGGFIVIDMSNEGPRAEAHWIAVLNRAVIELRIPPQQLILVNQNLRFGLGSSDQAFLGHVAIGHYFVSQSVHVLKRLLPDDAQIAAHCAALLSARKEAPDAALKHFICLNFTPRWFRWATVLHLSLNGLLDRGYVSFPGKTNFKLPIELDLDATMPPLTERAALLAHVPQLLERCPLELDISGSTTTSPDFDYPIGLMTTSLFHIITESEMSDGLDMLRITEKIIKPIVGLQPFIIAGNPKTLSLLKSMGFRTFEPLFDENYDAIYDPVTRLDAVFTQIDRVAAMPIERLREAVERLNETLIHNLLHLMVIGPLIFNVAVKNRFLRLVGAHTPAR